MADAAGAQGAVNGSGAPNGAVASAAANGAGAGAGAAGGAAAANGSARPTNLADALGVQDGDGAGQPNGQGGGQPNGQQAQGAAGGAPYYPEGLPAAYRGASDRDTIEKMAKDLSLVRRAPEKAEGYTLQLDGETAQRYGDLDKDPVVPLVRKAAHAAGLDQGQFQALFTGLYKELRDGGMLEAPIDIDAEVKLLAPKAADPATAKVQASARLKSVFTALKGIEGRGIVSKQGAEALRSAAATAAGAIALEKLLGFAGEQGVQAGGMPGAAVESKSDAMRLMDDERYSTTSPKHDPGFRRDADERIKRAVGVRR